jgi:predicted site-specific integrase-resolvase
LSEKRKDFLKLIEMILEKKVSKVYITHKDRLVRFGFNILERICKHMGVDVIVINEENKKSLEQELVDDMLSIITSFSGRLYGKRSSKTRKIREKLKEELSENNG